MVAGNLGTLSVFLTVAEELSFTKAAKRLGVSPSAISHSMREVEAGAPFVLRYVLKTEAS